jgi:hypothetical protein
MLGDPFEGTLLPEPAISSDSSCASLERDKLRISDPPYVNASLLPHSNQNATGAFAVTVSH